MAVPRYLMLFPVLDEYKEYIPDIEKALDDPSPAVRSAAFLVITTPENLYTGRLEQFLGSEHDVEVRTGLHMLSVYMGEAREIPEAMIPIVLDAIENRLVNYTDHDLHITGYAELFPLIPGHEQEKADFAIRHLDMIACKDTGYVIRELIRQIPDSFPWQEHRHHFIELYETVTKANDRGKLWPTFGRAHIGKLFATYNDEEFFNSICNIRYTYAESIKEYNRVRKRLTHLSAYYGYLSVRKMPGVERTLLRIWDIYPEGRYQSRPREVYIAFSKYTPSEINRNPNLTNEEKRSFIENIKRSKEKNR